MRRRLVLLLALVLAPVSAMAQAAPPAFADAPHRAAVIVTFDAKDIQPRFAAGLADEASGRRVTADDPVRVASISKIAVALGVMLDTGERR